MKINDDDIIKMLAELPEIELPEGFHDEVMQRVQKEAHRRNAYRASAKKRRAVWYIGSFTAAAAMVAIIITVTNLNFGPTLQFDAVAEVPRAIMATPAPYTAMTAEPEAAGGLWTWVQDEAEAVEEESTTLNMRLVPLDEDEYADDADDDFIVAQEAPVTPEEIFEDEPDFFAEADEDGADMDMAPLIAAAPLPVGDVFDALTTISIVPFPDKLPTEDPIFTTEDRFAVTFELTIAVDDISYAQQLADQMDLQPTYEDLEATFYALYALGTVHEYRVMVTDIYAIEDTYRAAEILARANKISIIFLQKMP